MGGEYRAQARKRSNIGRFKEGLKMWLVILIIFPFMLLAELLKMNN